jgi:tetratricopeptide (TPR) repeat protein
MKVLLAIAVTAAVASALVVQSPPPQDPPPHLLTAGVDVRDGPGPAIVEDPTGAAAFDPRAIVDGAWALEYAMIVQGGSSPGATAAQVGLDRLAAADYPAAIAAFQAALADPAQKGLEASTAFLLGWAHHGAGDDRQAITAWRRAASADPTMVRVHLAIADAYVGLSQRALAIQALRAGLAALPGSPELLDKLARVEQQP